MSTYYETMKYQVEIGNGQWIYQGGDVNIYQPYEYEGSSALRKCAPNDISLCVTYLADRSYYDDYDKHGTMHFVLTPTELYLAYFSNGSDKDSEFARRDNEYDDMNFLIARIYKQHLPHEIDYLIYPDAEDEEDEEDEDNNENDDDARETAYVRFIRREYERENANSGRVTDPMLIPFADDDQLAIELEANPTVISEVDPEHPNYYSIAMHVVASNPAVIQHINTSAKAYPALVRKAVQMDSSVLQYVNPENPVFKELADYVIQKDPAEAFNIEKIKILAVPASIQYIEPTDPNYYKLAMLAINKQMSALQYIPLESPLYDKIVLPSLDKMPAILQYVDPAWPHYFGAAMKLVHQPGFSRALDLLNPSHQRYDELALAAIQTNPRALQSIDPTNPHYYELAMVAIKQNPDMIQYVRDPQMQERIRQEYIKANAEVDRIKELAERLIR